MMLLVVITSTRPTRQGPAVARWFEGAARRHANFEVELVDLADVALPFLDEPEHPRLGKYAHPHTKAWSAKVDAADAFVFALPEYNAMPPATFVNAIDFLAREWAYKPAAFVSYGGAAGGARAVQVARAMLAILKTMPIPESVLVPNFKQFFDASGAFVANEGHEKAAVVLLDELHKWAGALKTLRASPP